MDWLFDGAHIYVCGDALQMAGDVEAALVEITADYGNRTRKQPAPTSITLEKPADIKPMSIEARFGTLPAMGERMSSVERASELEIFAVCAVDGIERGNAKSFRLSRITDTGESRPFPIVIIRTLANEYFGYVNSCPHQGIWLNIGSGEFFAATGPSCGGGRHGANFEIDTGCASMARARASRWSRLLSRWSAAMCACAECGWWRTIAFHPTNR